jgi:hypothetical protein
LHFFGFPKAGRWFGLFYLCLPKFEKMKQVTALEASLILGVFKKLGYKFNRRPFELNLIGVRKDSTTPNKFDDTFYVVWFDDQEKIKGWKTDATTDPGTYWLNNPMRPQGTAILKAGQYPEAYSIGLHRGQYKALTQSRPVTVVRDYDRDAVLDFDNGTEQRGLFGINIHRATANGKSLDVDKYSAGCQVIADAQDFEELMKLAEKHRERYGNAFTYTLIDERATLREKKKRIVYYSLAASGLFVSAFVAFKYLRF